MKAPDYRQAACCFNCHFLARLGSRCTKHGGKIDDLHVCADFVSREEMEAKP